MVGVSPVLGNLMKRKKTPPSILDPFFGGEMPVSRGVPAAAALPPNAPNQKPETTAVVPPAAKEKPKYFTDVETGRASGVTMGGKDFLFDKALGDVQEEIIQRETAKMTGMPQGAAGAGAGAGQFNTSSIADEARMAQRTAQITEQEAAAAQEFRAAGVFNKPTLTDLSPAFMSSGTGTDPNAPVLGSLMQAMAFNTDLRRAGDIDYNSPNGEELLRMGIRNKIDKKVIEDGDAVVNRLTVLIEGIPVVGEIVGKYLGGLGTPTGKALTIKSTIIETQKFLDQVDTSEGINPTVAFDVIRSSEEKLIEMESKLKLLIMQSPTLRAAPFIVREIEVEIDKAKQKVQNSKLKVAERRIKGIQATDPQLWDTLDRFKMLAK